MTDKVETIVKAAAIGGLICVSPVVSGTIIGVNVLAKHVIDDKITGRNRKLAFAGMNAVLCLAAGGVSVFYSWIPGAIIAAGLLTYMFSCDTEPCIAFDKNESDRLDAIARGECVVLDADIVS